MQVTKSDVVEDRGENAGIHLPKRAYAQVTHAVAVCNGAPCREKMAHGNDRDIRR